MNINQKAIGKTACKELQSLINDYQTIVLLHQI
jgi:hypothetical protein